MEAFIFDMDGVIIDSEPMHNATLEALLREYGADVDKKYMFNLCGLSSAAMFGKVKCEKQINVTFDEFSNTYNKKILTYAKEHSVYAIAGITELLQQLYSRHIPMAVASSSPMEFIKANIKKLGFTNYFRFLLSGTAIPHGKPAPDIYLAAAKKLDVAPKDCVVLEDSHNGVQAAKEAGMFCIGFQNPNSGDQDITRADMIVHTIKDIDITAL